MTNEMLLLAIFCVLWLYQILLLAKAIKRKEAERFVLLGIFEISCAVFARILVQYFKVLPTGGFLPGLTYLGHSLFSWAACAVYLVMFVITMISWIATHCAKRKKMAN